MTMTPDQITGILRAVLSAIGGFFVAKGLVSGATFDWLASGALTMVPLVWSWLSNRPSSIAAQAQGLPGVTVTTTTSAGSAVQASVAAAKQL